MAYKYYNTKVFNVKNSKGDEYTIVCETQNTSYGFRHVAEIRERFRVSPLHKTKSCYYNRTWESFEYETVIKKLLDKSEEIDNKESVLKQVNGEVSEEVTKGFNNIAMIAKIGELFTSDKKEQNDWKARMLKAGLESKGLIMPKDWDTLTEEEKERRLNGVIDILAKK